jgi:hypothetical protein
MLAGTQGLRGLANDIRCVQKGSSRSLLELPPVLLKHNAPFYIDIWLVCWCSCFHQVTDKSSYQFAGLIGFVIHFFRWIVGFVWKSYSVKAISS